MMQKLPDLFIDRLKEIIPPDHYEQVFRNFSQEKAVVLRINTLKITRERIREFLKNENIAFSSVTWCQEALTIERDSLDRIKDMISQGCVYQQRLSSLLVSLILDPKPGMRVLDLCAAPGSKTSHIAAIMNNQGEIVCVDNVRERFYKLKSVLSLLGVANAELKIMDGRKFRIRGPSENQDDGLFDRVLVDAPCSSEGRFHVGNKKTTAYWSLRKIKDMVNKQRGLILNASRCLSPDGVLVYSTCTFAPEENEGTIDWVLKKGGLKVVPIEGPGVKIYPAVRTWRAKTFHPSVKHCLRILPDGIMDGFFITKLKKI